ncbi:MAG: peptide ABC transporter substrate-binding protein [Gemmatimonadaceae bacterium]|nr:peptide ABC transporter substrate-binding protein [Gemmatimonadaceae bacterium]
MALCVVPAACSESSQLQGNSGPSGGTIVVATTAEPDALFPPVTATLQGRQVTELLFDNLAQVGTGMNSLGDSGFVPRLAQSWTWADDSLSIAFKLNPKAAWHDGRPVRPSDVVFSFHIYTDSTVGSPVAAQLSQIDSISSRDSTTAVVWFKHKYPRQFFDAASQMLILPEHIYSAPGDSVVRKAAELNPVGSGRFRFGNWKYGESITLLADTLNYRGRPGIDRVQFVIAPEFTTALTKFLTGEADVFEALRPENLADLSKHPGLKTIRLPGMAYVFMQFNLRDPKNPANQHEIFSNKALRTALSMALDRDAMVRNVFDSLASVAVGPTVRAYPTTPKSLPRIAFDTEKARRMLDSLGWRDTNGDGVRERNGRELTFSMLVPSSSRSRERMAVLIQEQFRQVGVRATIESLDFPALMQRQSDRDFDTMLWAWQLTPSPSGLRQTWTSTSSRTKSGSNFGSYENRQFDVLVDSALAESNSERSIQIFERAYKVIIDDAPAIWLYEPKTVLGVQGRIRTTPMRPDAWWLSIADWTIPPGERIPRDRVPPGK